MMAPAANGQSQLNSLAGIQPYSPGEYPDTFSETPDLDYLYKYVAYLQAERYAPAYIPEKTDH